MRGRAREREGYPAPRLRGRPTEGYPAPRLHALIQALEAVYGRPSLDEHRRLKPLEELILTILSQNTNDTNRDRAWEAMRARYRDWSAVVAAPRRQLESAIRVGGLAPTKSARIQEVLRQIRKERGAFDLDFLLDLPVDEAEAYLRKFKGVGLKTIRCVLLFACGKPVIPVDTHIFRVGKRLGLFPAKATPEKAHAILQEITPSSEVYPFHVNLITHGRRVCKAPRPRCEQCPVTSLCGYYASLRAPVRRGSSGKSARRRYRDG